MAFNYSFLGEESSDLDAHLYEEYHRLAKTVKLVVITEKVGTSHSKNIKVIKAYKISKPIAFRPLIRILAYSYETIKHRNDFDVVYTRSLGLNFLISSIIAKRILKKKLVFLISESRKTHTSLRSKIFRPFLKNVLKISDSLVTSSEFLIDEIQEYLVIIDRKKLNILHEAVDTTKFKPKISNPENIILTVARIDPVKGLENLINSIPLILKKIPNVKIKIIGSIRSRNYFLLLKNIIIELKCEKFVEFVGPIPHDKLPNLLSNSKIFILTSKTEAASISTLEAMATGLPVIVTKVGGMLSLIKNGINGFLVEPDDPEAVAEKAIKLLTDDSLRAEIGKNARETIEKKYSWDSFIDGLTNLFQN